MIKLNLLNAVFILQNAIIRLVLVITYIHQNGTNVEKTV